MTQMSVRPRRRAFGWGIAGTVIASLGVLAVGVILLLAFSVDENYAWFLLVVLPFALIAAALGGLLGVVGVVLARVDRGGYSWPAVALVLGAAQLLLATVLLNGPTT